MPTIPTPHALRDRIASIDVLRSNGGGRLVLPSSAMVLGFQLSGSISLEAGPLDPLGVTGLLRQGRRFRYGGDTTSVLVRFKPGAGRALGVPAVDLSERSVALEAMLGRSLRPLAAGILRAGSLAGAMSTLAELLQRIPYASDPLVEAALEALGNTNDSAGVASVARRLQVSERQLSRRFLASVGIAPKRYAGLLRFERAVAALRGSFPLADAALAAGYYDQPHLAREIRAFAGMTPRQLAQFLRPGMSDSYKPPTPVAAQAGRHPSSGSGHDHTSGHLHQRAQGNPGGPVRGLHPARAC